jgi:hypothetical protein
MEARAGKVLFIRRKSLWHCVIETSILRLCLPLSLERVHSVLLGKETFKLYSGDIWVVTTFHVFGSLPFLADHCRA